MTFILSNQKGDKSLRLSVKNLLDEEYVNSDPTGALLYDYPHSGRQLYLEARINF